MPINGVATLDDVVQGYQQGQQYAVQRQEQKRQQKMQEGIDAANAEAARVLDASKAEWAMSGAQGEYRPSDITMMRAAEARGQALAKSGDWDNFVKNDVAVAGQRLRMRSEALRQFELDGDPTKLAQTLHATVFDGRQIKGIEMLPAGDKNAPKGAPSGPARMRITYDDGKAELVDPVKMVQGVKLSLTDPAKAAQAELEHNLKLAQILAKGGEDRQTEDVKHKNTLELADKNNASRERIATLNADTKETVAEIGADSREKVATTRAAGGGGGGGGGAGARLQSTKVDANGNIVGVFRDGTTKTLIDKSGKPIRSGDWSKRVDKLVEALRKSGEHADKSERDLRRLAEESLGSAAPAAAPTLGGGRDFSNLWGGSK